MRTRPVSIVILLTSLITLAACVPPPLVVGAGAAVGADALLENEQGGDGLF
ncbi:MAG: hypothetical protein AAFY77_07395 [Pseudomonadota bacterium]